MADDLKPAGPPTAAAGGVYPGGVTVVICTYNRRPLLEKLIDSIRPQLQVDYPLEVLIVDNNSSDDTAAYARTLPGEHPAFSYLFERRQGLSHARNAGAAAARHEFLLYLDDDALLPPHYLPTLGPRLAEHDPDFFGGPLYPLYVDPKPAWFPESLEVRRKTARSGLDDNVVLTGANYGVRKSVLAKVGGFDPAYGMSGGKVGMLEERLVIEGYRRLTPPTEQKIYYGLDHFILNHTPAHRMTVGFQVKRIFIGNAGFIRWSLEQGVRSPGILLSQVWSAFWGEVAAVAAQAPRLWRERASEPEKPMLALVKLTYRSADLWGALSFFASDFGKVRRARARTGDEDRPLRATLFTVADPAAGKAAKPGKTGKTGDAGEIEGLRQAVAGSAELEVVSIAGMSDDAIRRTAADLNLRAQDVLLTDSPKAARALAVLRGTRPNLQFVLWLRDTKPLNYLKSRQHLWEKRAGVFARLARDRALVRGVDQVVASAAWLDAPLARALLPLRSCVVIPSAPPPPPGASAKEARAAAALQAQAREGWLKVLGNVRAWAPRRLAG